MTTYANIYAGGDQSPWNAGAWASNHSRLSPLLTVQEHALPYTGTVAPATGAIAGNYR